ncbi:MAG TPA: Ig-like domain-containing protein [Mycobacteriales bacterium]|nr:Ig-like domain-containing protein [Mycobacteriales bacterium]
MSYVRRVAALAVACVAGGLLGVVPAAAAYAAPPAAPLAGPSAAPPAAPPAAPGAGNGPEWVGTYQRLAKDMVEPDGSLRDVYSDILQVGSKSYRLRLPKGTTLQGGTPVRVRGTLAGDDLTADEVTPVGAPAKVATTGTTKVLVILAYWTAPDDMTVTKAKNQVFSDDDSWYGEVSYGQLALTGTAVGWYKILAPTGGHCWANYTEIMERAKAKAQAAGHDPALYDRTMVYFPACGGDAAGAAGWAYQPGTEVWMNGYFDRRVSVHEQGHNYGLPHAHTYSCMSGGVSVTLGGTCGHTEYGDDYDAMGAAPHAAHFSGAQKASLSWMTGKTRVLSSTETTFTLPPYEKTADRALTAVVTSPTIASRKYWMEYRQAIGYDNTLPAGATSGVLVHMADQSIPTGNAVNGPFLLDMTPQDGFGDAVIPAGGAWTSPDGIRITVGTVTATGAQVTVKGGAAPPVVPTVPRNVAVTGGDGSVRLTWEPPTSNGGDTVQSYVVTGSPGSITQTVDGRTRSLSVGSLTNGTAYSFSVAARNSVGTGPASTPIAATPTAQLPNVAVTAPLPGATISAPVTLAATATPHEASGAAIDLVSFSVDGQEVGWDYDAPHTFEWDPSQVEDGGHTITATAYDTNFRYRTSAPVSVTVKTPRPTIAITAPANDAVITTDVVELSAVSAPAPGGAEIQWVTYELTDGTPIGYAGPEESHRAQWDTYSLDGTYDVVAKVYDADGRSGTSAPVRVTVSHPKPSVVITAPADGVTVTGPVTVTAAATPNAETQMPVNRVDFATTDGLHVGSDYEAPFSVEWDTSEVNGEQVVVATAYDDSGRSAASAGRTIIVNNPVPAVVVTSPAAGQQFAGQVTFAATATPNAQTNSPIARVVFALDGDDYATDETAPYSVTWDSGRSFGDHAVTATAYDAAGRFARSVSVPFAVKYPVPSVGITQPANGATLAAGSTTIVANALPDPRTPEAPVAFVEFLVDGASLGWDDDGSNGWSAPWVAAPGEHVLTAQAWDVDFSSATSAPVNVTVVNLPGAPTGVTAAAGGDRTATVSWTAPGDGGSPILGYVVVSSTGTEYPAAGSPFQVAGLTNGTGYSFRVKARTTVGFGPLSAATATVVPGTRTALTIALSRGTVRYGSAIAVTGTLTRTDSGAPLAAQAVQLLACPTSTSCSTVVGTGTTSDLGKVTIAYVPKQHRYLRLRFVASGRFLGVTTAGKRVLVAAVVTSAISRTSVVLGKGATVSGKVIPAHSGKRVYLQRLTSAGWRNVTYLAQTSTGSVAFTVRPTAKGTYRYRLYFAGDTDHLAGTSPTRTLKVT